MNEDYNILKSISTLSAIVGVKMLNVRSQFASIKSIKKRADSLKLHPAILFQMAQQYEVDGDFATVGNNFKHCSFIDSVDKLDVPDFNFLFYKLIAKFKTIKEIAKNTGMSQEAVGNLRKLKDQTRVFNVQLFAKELGFSTAAMIVACYMKDDADREIYLREVRNG